LGRPFKIRLPDPREQLNDAFIPFFREDAETVRPITIHEGGRGSGKSRNIAQALLWWSLKYRARFALIRKVADTIRNSQFREIEDQVAGWGLQDHFSFTTSPLAIKTKRGSEFVTAGLDKNSKIKSLANVDVAWIEEAEEMTAEDFLTLSLTIRGQSNAGKMKRIVLSFNRTAGNWTEKEFFNADGTFKENRDIYHLHTTFQDNKFLDKPFLDRLEYLKGHDFELYQKNALGLPILLKGLVFTNWRECDEFPRCPIEVSGLDFGFNDPNVLVRVGIQGRDIYVDELMYERRRSVNDLLEDLRSLNQNGIIEKYTPMYADSEAPDKIADIYAAGWNVKACVKGKGSVQYGIELLKGFTIHITRRSTNIRKDFESYKWKSDRDGNPVDKIEPNHAYSHGPDAVRYAVVTYFDAPGITSDDTAQVEVQEMEAIEVARGY
jgi:phage terminase large subunit